MDKYIVAFKLYRVWLCLVFLAALVVFYISTNVLASVITLVVSAFLIYFIAGLWVNKYAYFFTNQRYDLKKIYVVLVLVGALVYSAFISIIKLLFNA